MLIAHDARILKAGLDPVEMEKRQPLNTMRYYVIFDTGCGLGFSLANSGDFDELQHLGELAGVEWRYESLLESESFDQTFRLITSITPKDIAKNNSKVSILAIGCKKGTTDEEGNKEYQFLEVASGALYDSEEEITRVLETYEN